MSFPASQPNYPDTQPTEFLGELGNGKGLSPILDDYGLDITGITGKLGTGASTPTAGKVLRANGTGTSVWGAVDLTADITGTLPVVNGGTGTTTSTGTGNVVLSSSPTIVTPTIASLTNAQHNHSNAAGGGQLTESGITLADVTTLDVSTTKHGLVPKGTNTGYNYLKDTGAWGDPFAGMWTNLVVSRQQITVTGTFANATGTGFFLGSWLSNSATVAQNDETKITVGLSAGTWTMLFWCRGGADSGIITVTSGGNTLGTIDCYNASTVEVKASIAGISVGASDAVQFNFKVATKNASSSNYRHDIIAVAFVRTA